jgi:arylsulfatase A-like enzyme
MIFVWPGAIEGGRRITDPVSMIDVLPTLLDLAGLPPAEIAQGQSPALLLRGEEGWRPRPVVLDEFRVAEDGSLIGNLGILNGRWGRSLEIRSGETEPATGMGRHPAPAGGRWKALSFFDVSRLLIYDVQADTRAIRHVADPPPDLVAESERMLWQLWQEHRALATRFEAGEEAELSPAQLEALRALGSIQ